MEMEDLIAVDKVIILYKVDSTFIDLLGQSGLIEITVVENTPYLYTGDIARLEKIIHLHYELEINIEGIETITHLLQRVTDLQDEVTALKNRLRLYEG